MDDVTFPASRRAALESLSAFVPQAGLAYASGRNTDYGPGRPAAVSRLSPCLRYRLITEQDSVQRVLRQHSLMEAEKFVQEVLWRTYWKGWLEMRPGIWRRVLEERGRQRAALHDDPALAAAEQGMTGLEGFDDWARELVRTGYLHNHARMWFASIWIFTLRLPWALGADFFLRHLIDADPASNTLSWRWVAGLQTIGKTYLATSDNIARYTNGRFAPKGLATVAVPLTEPAMPSAIAVPPVKAPREDEPSLLLVTHEDLNPETLFPQTSRVSAALVAACPALLWGEGARHFVNRAAEDAATRIESHFACPAAVSTTLDPDRLVEAAGAAGVRQIVTAYAPVGPVADALAHLTPVLEEHGIRLTQLRRRWDDVFWPHAGKGFFSFKDRIPDHLRQFGMA